jgi:hypothetical protein
MAQAQVSLFMELSKTAHTSKNVGDLIEFSIQLNKSKRARLYYSKSYRDYVLSFNINSTKSFIIDRRMWKILKKYLNFIENELGN